MRNTLTALLLIGSSLLIAQTKTLPFAACQGADSVRCGQIELAKLKSDLLQAGFESLGYALNDSLYYEVELMANGELRLLKSYSYLSPALSKAGTTWLKDNLTKRLMPGKEGIYQISASSDLSALKLLHRSVFEVKNKPELIACYGFNQSGQEGCLRYLDDLIGPHLGEWSLQARLDFKVYFNQGQISGMEFMTPFVNEKDHDRIYLAIQSFISKYVCELSLLIADPFFFEFSLDGYPFENDANFKLQFQKMQSRHSTEEQVLFLADKVVRQGDEQEKSLEELKGLLSEYGLPLSGKVVGRKGSLDIDSLLRPKLAKIPAINEQGQPNPLNFLSVTPPIWRACKDKKDIQEARQCFSQYVSNYVGTYFVFPPEARERGVSARIFISFIVGKDGRIDQIEIVKGAEYLMDIEAIRVISEIPICEQPALLNGEPVPMSFTLPIHASIQ